MAVIDQRSNQVDTSGRIKRSKKTKHEERNAALHAKKLRGQTKQQTSKPQTINNHFNIPDYKPGMGSEFYSTREWRSIRFDVIRSSNGCCVYCGRSAKVHGIVIHIDHIKPRSKFPELELVKSNLQVTCEDCNIGKGAQIL